MKKDATFKWDNTEFVNFYTNSANVIILERIRLIKVILEIIEFHFPTMADLNILDLGCGDGIITKYIFEKSPNNKFFLIDASAEMLKKAKENLSKANTIFRHISFEDYIESGNNRGQTTITRCVFEPLTVYIQTSGPQENGQPAAPSCNKLKYRY